MTVDEKYMRLALRLAARGGGQTSPNPVVGAVIVKGKAIVGRGYHHRAGEPHAEVLALRQAGEKARGATLYLNLEPCDHFGRTPPCTQAILKARINRVVAGMKDPNPIVSGKGIRRLRRSGIRVDVGVLEEECRELNAAFVKSMTTGMPWVILKVAASLDGKIATRSGDSRWITSETSRNYVHHLRQTMDAVMVGIGTVLRDDPLLTARPPGVKKPHQPLRVIVDSRLRIPFSSKIIQTAVRYPTLLATTSSAPRQKIEQLKKTGTEVMVVPKDRAGRVHLAPLMKRLGARGVRSILLEGGSRLNAAALEAGIMDRLLIFIAPKIIGGERAPGISGGEGILRMGEAEPVQILRFKKSGPDLLIEGAIQKRPQFTVHSPRTKEIPK